MNQLKNLCIVWRLTRKIKWNPQQNVENLKLSKNFLYAGNHLGAMYNLKFHASLTENSHLLFLCVVLSPKFLPNLSYCLQKGDGYSHLSLKTVV